MWSKMASPIFLILLAPHCGLPRRAFLAAPCAASAVVTLPAFAAPFDVRRYTALAPLGPADARLGSDKLRLPLGELAATLARDVSVGAHGRGGYFVSADLTPEIFADDCDFVDPTNSVKSLSKYVKALKILFDPALSSCALVEGPIIDEGARTVRARVRSAGVLNLPWRPRIAPYETDIVWTVGADSGLVVSQEQTWSISAAEALVQTFTPDWVELGRGWGFR